MDEPHMVTRPKIDVVLNEEGRNALAADPIHVLIREGKYFTCIAVEQLDTFLNMKVLDPAGEPSRVIEVAIPSRFVLYTISAEGGQRLGFRT